MQIIAVAKCIKCRSCNFPGDIAAACLPTASNRAVEEEVGQGQSTLALEYQPDKQQQQPKQAAQINYVQTFSTLQSTYTNREAGWYYSLPQQQQQGNTTNINVISRAVTGEKEEKREESREKSQVDSAHDLFVNK